MGAPKADIKELDVIECASVGCTNEDIAIILGVSKDTIERRFAAAIKKGRAKDYMSFRRKCRDAAFPGKESKEKPNVGFAVLYAKLRGWYVDRVDQKVESEAKTSISDETINRLKEAVKCATE